MSECSFNDSTTKMKKIVLIVLMKEFVMVYVNSMWVW